MMEAEHNHVVGHETEDASVRGDRAVRAPVSPITALLFGLCIGVRDLPISCSIIR